MIQRAGRMASSIKCCRFAVFFVYHVSNDAYTTDLLCEKIVYSRFIIQIVKKHKYFVIVPPYQQNVLLIKLVSISVD